jgi:transcriptional regulator with XRE-family HTH domain
MPITSEERKARVKAKKGLQRRIARKLGLSETHVSLVASGEREGSDRLKREIARGIGLSVAEAFAGAVAEPEPTEPEPVVASA